MRDRLVPILALVVCSVAGLLASCSTPPGKHVASTAPPLQRYQYTRPKWGSVFRIILFAPDEATANAAAEAAFARFDVIGQASNDYDPNSEVSRLSRMTADGPMTAAVPVSEDLYRVLEASIIASEKSGGAFDVTVGPLVHLWRRSRELVELPTKERLDAARAAVGYRLIRLTHIETKTPDGRTVPSPAVQLMAAKMRLDLGGIVTGYATTDVLRVLKEHGVSRALIDAAGDLAASDPPPALDGWRVAIQAIEDPWKTVGYVKIANCACSTSGDTYRYVEINGVRYSHIVDPKTGLGLTRRVGVTVITDDGTTCDWLDTALPVMELKDAQALVEGMPGTAARITTIAPDGGIAVWESSRFKAFWDTSAVTTISPATTQTQGNQPSPGQPE